MRAILKNARALSRRTRRRRRRRARRRRPRLRATRRPSPRSVSGQARLRCASSAYRQATYNRYARATRAGTKLEQLLAPTTPDDPHGLQRALLASFDVDIDWLESLFPPSVPVTYIGHSPPGDAAPPGFYASDRMAHWEMCIPRKPHARALQHIKLIILFYATHARVVVSSGNLTPLDWSRYENVRGAHSRSSCISRTCLPRGTHSPCHHPTPVPVGVRSAHSSSACCPPSVYRRRIRPCALSPRTAIRTRPPTSSQAGPSRPSRAAGQRSSRWAGAPRASRARVASHSRSHHAP